jgi:SAM-dependent methyltransferase
MSAWTSANLRHLRSVFRFGPNRVATVYESIGDDFFLSPAPGWLNLGLWEGTGTEEEAPDAPRRLVEAVARHLPVGGTIVDVGNGLAAQDVVIAEVVKPTRLVAVNITEAQLRAGRERLARADASGIAGDAVRLPLRAEVADGVVSIEAAFHFDSRLAFFREARRVLRRGGVLSMSDIVTDRYPRSPREAIAAFANLRAWGLRTNAAVTATRLAADLRRAGFVDVAVERVGRRVFDPAFHLFRSRLEAGDGEHIAVRTGARVLLREMEILWERRLVDYVLVRATAA